MLCSYFLCTGSVGLHSRRDWNERGSFGVWVSGPAPAIKFQGSGVLFSSWMGIVQRFLSERMTMLYIAPLG